VALWYLTPEKLTPIVNDAATSSLNAEVKAERVELTFWSTFPRLEIKVDSLTVVSRRFDSLTASEREALPQNPDSLLKLHQLQGGINVLSLIGGKIELYDVSLDRPDINLVILNDSSANFDIVPPSEPDTEPSSLPTIGINHFTILGDMPVRYRDMTSGTDITLTLAAMSLDGEGDPLYTLKIDGNAAGGMTPAILTSQPIGLNGNIEWDQSVPAKVKISDSDIRFGAVNLGVDTDLDFTDALTVNHLNLTLRELSVNKAVEMIPESMRGELSSLDTDMKIDAEVRISTPFSPIQLELPVAEVDANVTASYLNFDKIRLPYIDLITESQINLAAPDRSKVNIRRFAMRGPAMDFEIKATLTRLLSNPRISGSFDGMLAFHKLPRRLLDKLPFHLQGTLRGNADINAKASDFNRKNFHRLKVNGHLTLDGFRLGMRDSTIDTYIHRAEFRLGTDSKIKIKEYSVDSLLTASLKIDTVAFNGSGVHIQGKTLSAGIGSKNVASSSDTTQINPIGGLISAEKLRLKSDSDSTHILLRQAKVRGSISRYNSESRSPLLRLNIESRRIRYADRFNRASLSKGNIKLVLHPKGRRKMSAAMRQRYDSIAALHPELSADSLLTLTRIDARKHRKARHQQPETGRENMDFGVDRSLKSWLRQWQASGEIKARKVRLFTPYFPTRNIMKGLDLTFSTDSIVLRDTECRSGKSDFTLSGSIRNISRAFTSRRGVPIELDFDVKSDTIDINDIMATAIKGAAFSHKTATENSIAALSAEDIEAEEDRLQTLIDADTDSIAPGVIVIPSNITAGFRMRAKHIHYNDLWLRNFSGMVSIFDGAVNMQEFKAMTDIGSFGLTALYSAPTKKDVTFAAGMKIKRFNLHEITHIMPQLDTIMPMLSYMEGIVDADAALTTSIDSLMNLDLRTTNMALKLSGDSLVLLDSDTFRKVAKWMLFKNKKRNMIDHMDVELSIHDGMLDLYPFIFDMDRYKLGVRGSNDAALNLDYHVAVLKSPIPFRFGINVKGTPEKIKIRLGRAKINEKTVASSRQLTDTVRINLLKEIRTAFRKGMRSAGAKGLRLQHREAMRDSISAKDDTLSASDSLVFIEHGLIEAPKPDSTLTNNAVTNPKNKNKKKKK